GRGGGAGAPEKGARPADPGHRLQGAAAVGRHLPQPGPGKDRPGPRGHARRAPHRAGQDRGAVVAARRRLSPGAGAPCAQMNWDSEYVQKLVGTALEEDIGAGDATVLATIPAQARGNARVIAREELICAGLPMAERVFRALDPGMEIVLRARDGDAV